jgi:hypothetical protein
MSVRAEMAMRAPPGPQIVLGGVGPVLPYLLVLDDEGSQKEPYPRGETDRGDYKSYSRL